MNHTNPNHYRRISPGSLLELLLSLQTARPALIGERTEMIDGRLCTVQVFAPVTAERREDFYRIVHRKPAA